MFSKYSAFASGNATASTRQINTLRLVDLIHIQTNRWTH